MTRARPGTPGCVDLTIAEACQKSKRKSVLAVGVEGVRVKFRQSDANSSPGVDYEEAEIQEPRASDGGRRPRKDPFYGSSSAEREEGVLRRSSTAKSLLDNKVGKNSRLDGGRR